jgi:hypothetical protein
VCASTAVQRPDRATVRCANCEARLSGPYCAICGQRAHESARSLATLFHDAWHVLTHVDGRLWQTLRRLAFNPGHLTGEYFRERRARYIPPFRLYLVLSLVFFGLAALTSAFDATPIRIDATDLEAAAVTEPAPPAEVAVANGGFDVRQCDRLRVEPPALQPALRDACRRAAQDGGRSIAHAFAANVPKMMLLFLPLMAATMLLLYWRPRRYYVEHLVFYLHVHAAMFLALSALMLLGALARLVPPLGAVTAVAGFAMAGYAGWYVWRAMRVYYGNGRTLTLAKFAAIAFAYAVFLGASVAGTALVSALTA